MKISVLQLMLLPLILAVDITTYSALRPKMDIAYLFFVLPLVNVLVLLAPRCWDRTANRPYWIGFEVGGLLIGILFLYFSWYPIFYHPFYIARSVDSWLRRDVPFWEFAQNKFGWVVCILTLDVILFTPPQLVFAHLFGVICKKGHRRILSAWRRSPTSRT